MDFKEEHHGVVPASGGSIKMTLGFWRPGAFTYKLQHLLGSATEPQLALIPASPMDLVDILPGSDLNFNSFVLQETMTDSLNFFFRLPLRGVYYLTIYAQVLLCSSCVIMVDSYQRVIFHNDYNFGIFDCTSLPKTCPCAECKQQRIKDARGNKSC